MTDDSGLFENSPSTKRLPLFEGKMIHQFDADAQAPNYWIDEAAGRSALLGRRQDEGQLLPYQRFRLAYRTIARGTDSRTMISTVLPSKCFSSHSLNVAFEPEDARVQLIVLSFLNSFCFDYFLRQQVSANLTQFFIYQCPVPRLDASDPNGALVADRAARLVCTTIEFDALAKEVGLRDHRKGATDLVDRSRLRAEIDGLVAHRYGLSDEEFLHILGTFPLIPEPQKVAAYNAYRDVARGLIQ